MHSIASDLFSTLAHLGGFGLLLMAVLDSWFLLLPLGNDLRLVGLTASHPKRFLYSASPRQYRYVQRHVEKHAGWLLAVAAGGPPQVPFRPVAALLFSIPGRSCTTP